MEIKVVDVKARSAPVPRSTKMRREAKAQLKEDVSRVNTIGLKWSVEEKANLINAVRQYGKDYSKLSDIFVARSSKQISDCLWKFKKKC